MAAVIKMGTYIHGVLIFYGCILSQFYGTVYYIWKMKVMVQVCVSGRDRVSLHVLQMWQSQIEKLNIIPSYTLSTSPSLTHYSAELPLRGGLIHDL